MEADLRPIEIGKVEVFTSRGLCELEIFECNDRCSHCKYSWAEFATLLASLLRSYLVTGANITKCMWLITTGDLSLERGL